MTAAEENLVTGRSTSVTIVRGVVWAILVGAALAALYTLVFGALDIVGGLTAGEVTVQLLASEPLPTAANASDVTIVSGSFETAVVVLHGLPGYIGALATTAKISGLLSSTAVTVAIALIGWALVRGTVFRRSLATWVTIAGGILLLGFLLSEALGAFSAMLVAKELNAGVSPFWSLAGVVDGGGYVTGVVLMLAGLAFQYGEHLQRDTQGLV